MGLTSSVYDRMAFAESSNSRENNLVDECEAVFDELQNYDIPSDLLDRVEAIFSQFLQREETAASLTRELEEAKQLKEVYQYSKAKMSIDKRVSLASGSQDKSVPLANVPLLPPPPPPPMPPSQPSTYKKLCWTKLANSVEASVFEQCRPSPDLTFLERFKLQQTPPAKILPPNPSKPVLDVKLHIKAKSVLLKTGMPATSLAASLLSASTVICDNEEGLEAIARCIPHDLGDLVQGFSGSLNECEEVYVQLSQVPNVRELVSNYLFLLQFEETAAELKICLNSVLDLCKRLQKNKVLQEAIGIVLVVGNAMNEHNLTYGNAQAFSISSLNSLHRVKSNSGDSTLLHCILDQLNAVTGTPYVSSVAEHILLTEVSRSNVHNLISTAQETLQTFNSLAACQHSEQCIEKVKGFLTQTQDKAQSLATMFDKTKTELQKCHQYFLTSEEYDAEGRPILFTELAQFYETVQTLCNKLYARTQRKSTLLGKV